MTVLPNRLSGRAFVQNIDLLVRRDHAGVLKCKGLVPLLSTSVAKPTGVLVLRTQCIIVLFSACLPIRWRPAAVSHNQLMLLFLAGTLGTAGTTAATAAEDFGLLRARGGGPVYFSVGECRKEHDLVGIEHARNFCFFSG